MPASVFISCCPRDKSLHRVVPFLETVNEIRPRWASLRLDLSNVDQSASTFRKFPEIAEPLLSQGDTNLPLLRTLDVSQGFSYGSRYDISFLAKWEAPSLRVLKVGNVFPPRNLHIAS